MIFIYQLWIVKMNLGIKGKWALVTGGANGLGEEISKELVASGCNIIITSRTKSSIINIKKKLAKFDVKIKGVEVDFLKRNWLIEFKK